MSDKRDYNFLKEGTLVAYVLCGQHTDQIYKIEVGRVKKVDKTNKKAFVYYHEGATAAATPFQYLFPIENQYCFLNNTLASLK